MTGDYRMMDHLDRAKEQIDRLQQENAELKRLILDLREEIDDHVREIFNLRRLADEILLASDQYRKYREAHK